MPSVIVLFAMLALIGSLQVANLKLVSQAAQLARGYAIGQNPTQISQLANQLQIQVQFGKQADWICVTATKLAKTWFIPNLPLTQTQCALPVGG
jgi:hydrogenase/urease accessory protein HupE